MKARVLVSILLLAAVILSACGSAPQTPAGTEQVPLTAESYPSPDSSGPAAGQGGYPSPQQVAPAAPAGGVLYPELKDGDQVEWYQALSMIQNGEVARALQSADRQVTLMLKDGRSLATLEPNQDDILKAKDQCGDRCKDLEVSNQ